MTLHCRDPFEFYLRTAMQFIRHDPTHIVRSGLICTVNVTLRSFFLLILKIIIYT